MTTFSVWALAGLLCVVVAPSPGQAQEHKHVDKQHGEHDHGDHAAPVKRPRVFLDKSPRIVQYQLNRLSNAQLLLVERATDHPKYRPVFTSILTRAGMSRQDRDEALAGLTTINGTDPLNELIKTLDGMVVDDRAQQRVGKILVEMLLDQPTDVLSANRESLRVAMSSDNPLLRAAASAGLITCGDFIRVWEAASRGPQNTLDYLAAVPLVRSEKSRSLMRDSIVSCLAEEHDLEIRRSAIAALAHVPTRETEHFRLVATLANDRELMPTAVRTLLSIPDKFRDAETASRLAGTLVMHAETTPAAERTSDEFIDAMQLADQLLARLPVDVSRSYRDRLREVSVRVVRINTVEEEMRYDTAYFAVEAGRPVQIVINNVDLMPHNLVIATPGALREVAELGAEVGPTGGSLGKAYVPDSDKVLFATELIQSGRQERLTFTAPTEPGEYPYVCTFPRHWMRMYGVMVVVPDLDAWLKDPQPPVDPVGNTRAFVQNWQVRDLESELDAGLRGRSLEIGQRLFKDATCAQCHKVRGQGGAVGPELTDVFKRWKGDRVGVLREILDPSHKIEPRYAVRIIVRTDGRTVSGIVTAEDKKSVTILDNPEAPVPTVVERDDIEEIIPSSKSMMPKALLDRFTKDEIFEIVNYLERAASHPATATP